jgi:hypothetical protein
MQRLRRAAFPFALVGAIAVALAVIVGDSAAELDNLVFTSRADRLRLVVPRGWRASDQPSYRGLLLWMARSQPPGKIVLATEPFTRALYCSWPPICRTGSDGPPVKYACALRKKLEAQRLRVGPVQAGPKENEAAGLTSIWFEYEDGQHFLRHAIAFSADRAISLVLSAPSNEARISHTRAFEQTLRTMQLLTEEETARTPWIDAGPDDAGDARPIASGAAPPPLEPVGPCAQRP